MHELSICQSLINQVEKVAEENNAQAVSSILLGIGALSGVEADLLQRAFSIAKANSLADSAQLQIKPLPVIVKCMECNHESEVSINKLTCNQCGNWQTQLISGDEMLLIRVELEKETIN